MEVEHVAERAVGKGGAEDGDRVPVGPVEDGRLVVDFGAEAGDNGAGRPDESFFVAFGLHFRGFLFSEHGV